MPGNCLNYDFRLIRLSTMIACFAASLAFFEYRFSDWRTIFFMTVQRCIHANQTNHPKITVQTIYPRAKAIKATTLPPIPEHKLAGKNIIIVQVQQQHGRYGNKECDEAKIDNDKEVEKHCRQYKLPFYP